MVVVSENAALFQGDRHARAILPALAAGESSSSQPPAQLPQEQKELHVLGLVRGVLSLDYCEEIVQTLHLQLCLCHCSQQPPTAMSAERRYKHYSYTVEPPNKGHLGTRSFVLCKEVSFIWRFLIVQVGISTSSFERCPLFGAFFN